LKKNQFKHKGYSLKKPIVILTMVVKKKVVLVTLQNLLFWISAKLVLLLSCPLTCQQKDSSDLFEVKVNQQQ